MVCQDVRSGSGNDVTGCLRTSYSTICKGGKIDADNLKEAFRILDDEQECIGTRKLAAQIVYRCEKKVTPNWLILTAASEVEPIRKSAEIFELYLLDRTFEIGISDEEYCFLTSLVQRIAKKKNEYSQIWGLERFNLIREKVFSVIVMLDEIRPEDVSHLIKSVVKLYQSKEDQLNLLDLCRGFPIVHLKAPLLISSILLSTHLYSEWLPYCEFIINQLTELAVNQITANAVAPLLSVFIDKGVMNDQLENALVNNLTFHTSSVRSNTVRCWLARASVGSNTFKLFENLLQALLLRWDETASGSDDDIWPPQIYETEEVSSIDPEWNWEESEDIWWMRDRIVHSFLSLLKIFAQKFPLVKTGEIYRPMIMRGLYWHSSEVRLIAFQLSGSLPVEHEVIERFVLVNATSTNNDLSAAIFDFAKSFQFTTEGKETWTAVENSLRADEKNLDTCPVYVPADLHDDFVLPPAHEIPDVVQNKLRLISSSSTDCPSFPEMYARLDAVNYHHRLYTKHMIMLMDALTRSEAVNNSSEIVAMTVWQIVSQCRLKAVVDRGCSHLETLMLRNKTLVPSLFAVSLQSLVSSSSAVRNLCISRVLWSACAVEPKLFLEFWITVKHYLSVDADPKVLSRILKTLKLFISKSECRLPNGSMEELFWFCIDVQEAKDFLVRSSAIILFGFIVRSFTAGKQVPLFSLITKQKPLWRAVCKRIAQLCTIRIDDSDSKEVLYRCQRILLLSFMTYYNFISPLFYSQATVRMLDDFKEHIGKVLRDSPDIRERRFIIDILVQMSSVHDKSQLLNGISQMPSVSPTNYVADMQYLAATLHSEPAKREVNCEFAEFDQSPFFRRVAEVRKAAETWRLDGIDESQITTIIKQMSTDLDFDSELPSQCAAYVCSQIAIGIAGKRIPSDLANTFAQFCIVLSNHTIPRVRAIVSRVAVNLGISDSLMHHLEFEKVLQKWAGGFVLIVC